MMGRECHDVEGDVWAGENTTGHRYRKPDSSTLYRRHSTPECPTISPTAATWCHLTA